MYRVTLISVRQCYVIYQLISVWYSRENFIFEEHMLSTIMLLLCHRCCNTLKRLREVIGVFPFRAF